MSLLSKYLEKIGVKNYNDLSEEEKKTYREWEEALSGRSLTEHEVNTFLHSELEEGIAKLTKTLTGDREDIFLKMKVEFIRSLLTFLDTPKREKETVERVITNQL
jgi:hypothetical protein